MIKYQGKILTFETWGLICPDNCTCIDRINQAACVLQSRGVEKAPHAPPTELPATRARVWAPHNRRKTRGRPGLTCGGEMGCLEPPKVNPVPTGRGSPCGSCQVWRGGRRQEQWQPPCATTRLWEQFPSDLTAPTPHPTHPPHTAHTPHIPRMHSIVQRQHRPGCLFLQGQGWHLSTDVAQGTGVRGHIGLSECYSRGWGGGSIPEKYMGFWAGRLRISALPPSD